MTLDNRSTEADRNPIFDFNRRAHLLVRSAPTPATAVQMPRPRHPKVGIEHQPVVPRDFEMPAVAFHMFDDAPCLRNWTYQPRRIKTDHPLTGERGSKGACGTMGGATFGH